VPDRYAPLRPPPGDGVMPLEQIIGWILEVGYEGIFDIELVPPPDNDEAAQIRGAEHLSEILNRLGVPQRATSSDKELA